MKKDILENRLFEDNEGRDHRKAEVVELDAATNFFTGQGFEVVKIGQTWRNVHGLLKKNDELSFLKMGSTAAIGDRVRNETEFNTHMNKKISESGIKSFSTPNIKGTGEFGDLFYYEADYYPGPLLLDAEKGVPDAEFESKLGQVGDINMFLLDVPNLDLSRDQEFAGVSKEERITKYIVTYAQFAEQVQEFGMDELVSHVKDFEKTFEYGFNHCDFTPWHLIKDGEKLILIDGEHASNFNPKYFDIAYFYHRLYTRPQGADSARKYLDLVRQKLGAEKIEKFNTAIKPILAARIIGGYWDTKTAGETDFSIHDQLKQEFLSEKVA